MGCVPLPVGRRQARPDRYGDRRGALVLRPVLDGDSTADGSALIVGAAYDLAALTAATTLAVFKPGRARRQDTPHADRDLTAAATTDQ